MPDHDVIIIGGGIVGLATAVGLLHRGVENVVIYEKALKLHPVGAAIGLFPNGLVALQELSESVHSKVQNSCISSRQSLMKDLQGKVLVDTDTTKSSRIHPNYLVWYLLQQYLAQDLKKEENMLHLGHVFESYTVDDDTGIVTVQVRARNDESTVIQKTCRVLVGADGIHSSVRTQFVGKRELRFHGKIMFRGVLDLKDLDDGVCPPAGVSLAYQGQVQGQLFACRETAPGIVTFTSMTRLEKPPFSDDNHNKKRHLLQLFKEYPPDVQHILARVEEDAIFENAVYDLQVVEERWSDGPVVLVGDAAHAMTPGMGQGANVGLEDACELSHKLSCVLVLDSHQDDKVAETLQDFWKGRIERVREIHLASCNKTKSVNQSTKDKPLDLSLLNPDFMDHVYNWKPSYCK